MLTAPTLSASLAACGGDEPQGGTDAEGLATAPEVQLGYFANVTHAAALIGLDRGTSRTGWATRRSRPRRSTRDRGHRGDLRRRLDMTYIGPNPAINAYAESDGEAVRIIAGATSGGAQLVVREGIDSPEDLVGTTLATSPSATRRTSRCGPGSPSRAWRTASRAAVTSRSHRARTPRPWPCFRPATFDGAWLPEPWASRLVLEAGASVLLDEKELWPDGQFVTTHLLVRPEILEQYPGTVEAVLRAHVQAVQYAADNPDEAKNEVNAGIESVTNEPLSQEVLDRSWDNLTVTDDPIAASLQKSAEDALAVGTL